MTEAVSSEPEPSTAVARPRVVRVVVDVKGIDRRFDYTVPGAWERDGRGALVQVGSLVRVDLHGRRVAGWVEATDVEPPVGVTLRPLVKVSGLGPDAATIDLARWAAWRWAGRLPSLLGTASPPTMITALPPPPARPVVPAALDPSADAAFARARAVVRRPPADDPFELALAAVRAAASRDGDALVLAPSIDAARRIGARLRRAGIAVALHPRDWALARAGATVVGARAAAFAPVARLGAVLVLDEHDEGYQEERTPTWHARDVAIERARRAGVPCVVASPTPTLESLEWGDLLVPSRAVERAGWPALDIVDLRKEDPAKAVRFSSRLVPLLRGAGPVVCVLNRVGRSKLLACAACGELARCERHRSPLAMEDDGQLVCPRGGERRPAVCERCGSIRMKNLRLGVTRVREELEALAARPVVLITGEHPADIDGPPPWAEADESSVFVGTEAVLHQVPHARVVVFLDIDQELLAPRYRAAEQAMTLLVRAARLVGGREHGRLVVQTRLPRHEVLDAVLHADPERLSASERDRRRALRLPPYSAQALVSGAAAAAFVERLGTPAGVSVRGPSDERWLVQAADHATLCDALASVERPAGRLRIEVDPHRI
jgi:primosomal protein N' (replication factor Y)